MVDAVKIGVLARLAKYDTDIPLRIGHGTGPTVNLWIAFTLTVHELADDRRPSQHCCVG